MTSFPAPECCKCVHLEQNPVAFMRCDAFPDGIPEEIWKSMVLHHAPFPGDHGIHFEPGSPSAASPPAGRLAQY